MNLYCCQCTKDVEARLTDGREIYPHREDLAGLPFWRCDGCGNYVGCHHKTRNRTRPLGNIPTEQLRAARKHIHRILDPLCQGNGGKRREIYARISEMLGYPYHTAEIKTIEEARKIYTIVRDLGRQAATGKGAGL